MTGRLFNRSITVAGIAAIFMMASVITFAQTSDSKISDADSVNTFEKLASVKADRSKTFSPVAKFSSDAVIDKENSKSGNAEPTKGAQNSSGSEWEFGFAPYLFLAGISGTLGANGRTASIDQSIGDVLGHFKAGLMGTFQARKGRFVMYDDIFWVKLSEESATPGGLYNTGKVTVNMTIFNPYAGVRVAESKGGSFDIIGGVRVTSVKNSLTFTPGLLQGFTAEQRKTWAAPVVGGHGLVNLSPKVYLTTYFDIGGGFGTHLTGQFFGGMGYRIKPKTALVFGYRYLKNDYSDSTGFVFDTNMNGLVVGANFRF